MPYDYLNDYSGSHDTIRKKEGANDPSAKELAKTVNHVIHLLCVKNDKWWYGLPHLQQPRTVI